MSARTGDAPGRIDTLRRDARRRRLLVVFGALAGLLLSSVHWLGFVAGGALVSLPQPSLRRGLLAGLAFGLLAWLCFLGWLALQGALGTYPTLGQLFALSAAIPILCGPLGSLARGVV